jgi:hypothetical protein
LSYHSANDSAHTNSNRGAFIYAFNFTYNSSFTATLDTTQLLPLLQAVADAEHLPVPATFDISFHKSLDVSHSNSDHLPLKNPDFATHPTRIRATRYQCVSLHL